MDTRRSFLKKAAMLSGSAGLIGGLPESIQKALLINPAAGSTFYDAEHIVFLMQENRSFDHTYGTLQGVRGFNDPRAVELPNRNKVWLQTDMEGRTYTPFRMDIQDSRITWMGCLPHGWTDQVDARNEGKYDQWLKVKRSGEKEFADLPLTLGYYTRQDIPFYYSLADAFTVCDQHFCSSLTGTTPNRLYFWGGSIRATANADERANVWNSDADYERKVGWKMYPERLEEAGVSWKIYQNEVSAGAGPEGEADGWLTNFGDNPLEYFTQYEVRWSPEYIAHLPKRIDDLRNEISKLEKEIADHPTEENKKKLSKKESNLDSLVEEQEKFSVEKFEELSEFEKNIHRKAFTNNRKDPLYHTLSSMSYQQGGEKSELKIPAGDILHQFREDVNTGTLPTVSWLVAPQHFSDHPDSPWFGAWYVSEVMDILTKNPEVWKKTIFILTYDENDGYFDHVPPFVAPNPYREGSGKVSEGIDASLEFVRKEQQSWPDGARESSIGLGYRVPLVIASPWTRGGWVCSEVFDHTSALQFLEIYLQRKTGKQITESNMSEWRRTVCGNLVSAFRGYNGERIVKPVVLEKESFIKGIHQAKFKGLPDQYRSLTAQQIDQINREGVRSVLHPRQERGIRSACSLPYELYADGNIDLKRKQFKVELKAGNSVFGDQSAGSPFTIYSINPYQQLDWRSWNYAIKAGKAEVENWDLALFENQSYHLRLYGPNGFFREFKGTDKDPLLMASCGYEPGKGGGLSGKIALKIGNEDSGELKVEIRDRSYGAGTIRKTIERGQAMNVMLDQSKSFGWYDFSVLVMGREGFEKRFAGRIETGQTSKTDPLMGMMV